MRNLRLVVGPLALAACADTNVLTIELEHGSESEAALAAELRELIDTYDLSEWIWTPQIVIDEDAGYLFNADRGSTLGIFLLIALPVVGVYFLGGWALLTFVVGAIFGGRVFWSAMTSGRIDRE